MNFEQNKNFQIIFFKYETYAYSNVCLNRAK